MLKIDPETQAVISHKVPEKPPAIEDLAAAVAKLKGEAGRRDEVFRKSVESQKMHGKVLEKKFDEMLRQVKENPDAPPPQARYRSGLARNSAATSRTGRCVPSTA